MPFCLGFTSFPKLPPVRRTGFSVRPSTTRHQHEAVRNIDAELLTFVPIQANSYPAQPGQQPSS